MAHQFILPVGYLVPYDDAEGVYIVKKSDKRMKILSRLFSCHNKMWVTNTTVDDKNEYL